MKFGIREIVFIAMLMAVPAAAWWFGFRPNNARNREVLEEIESKQAKLRELNKARATLGDLKTEITSLAEAVKAFRDKLPSEKEMDKVLKDLWLLAESNRLSTKSIRTVKPGGRTLLVDPEGPYAEQPISMQLHGPFMGFYSFLLALENQARIIRIREMKVEKLPRAEEGHIRATCQVSVFFERLGEG